MTEHLKSAHRDSPTPAWCDGQHDYPDSMLDFAWVAGPAKHWDAEATVVVREGDFPDDDKTSDHRPVTLHVTPDPIPLPVVLPTNP